MSEQGGVLAGDKVIRGKLGMMASVKPNRS